MNALFFNLLWLTQDFHMHCTRSKSCHFGLVFQCDLSGKTNHMKQGWPHDVDHGLPTNTMFPVLCLGLLLVELWPDDWWGQIRWVLCFLCLVPGFLMFSCAWPRSCQLSQCYLSFKKRNHIEKVRHISNMAWYIFLVLIVIVVDLRPQMRQRRFWLTCFCHMFS